MIDLVCVLDRSGSMYADAAKVISSFNEFIAMQRGRMLTRPDLMRVTLVLFDNQYEVVYKSIPIDAVPELTSAVYNTRGMTALNDAVGKTINELRDNENVFMYIETDGHENSSKEFNGDQIKTMIRDAERRGWEFMFTGADLTKQQTLDMASSYGIKSSNTISINKTSDGYATRNALFSTAVSSYVDDVTSKSSSTETI